MSQLCLRRFSRLLWNHHTRCLLSKLNPYCQSTFCTDAYQEQPIPNNSLHTSYANIKAAYANQQNTPTNPDMKNISPLLSHLKLLNSDNTLTPIDFTNWSELRQILSQTVMYYVHDFCHDFASKHANNEIMSNEFINRTQYMLLKTNIGGKNNRGLLHIISVFHLRKYQNKAVSATDMHNALTTALCIEALQSYFLVMDDVMDQSETRRGQPCWYKYPNVGLKAVNDGPIIESWLFWLIHNRILSDDSGNNIYRLDRLFREVNMLTLAGQSTDLELLQSMQSLKQNYTLERYETIAMYKTSFYSFYLPYASALYLCGFEDGMDSESDEGFLFHACRQFSLELGIKFQIDDDFLDCFGDEEVTGKRGTDIQDFKCSWLMVKALESVNAEQFEVLKKHYGKQSESDVEIVKDLFRELQLENVYYEWEMDAHNKLMAMVQQSEGVLPTEMFTVILDKLHKRNK